MSTAPTTQTSSGPKTQKETKQKDKVTLIVFSGELDKVLASFIIATSAAAMGKDVTMFFTFWGLNAIKRHERKIANPSFILRMLNRLNMGGARRLALSKFHMLGMGTSMMKNIMAQHKMPTVEEFIEMAHEMGVKIVACTTTITVMGLTDEDFIPQVDLKAGAVAYLNEASSSSVNLFI